MCQITHPKVVSYAPYLSNSALPTLNLFESAGPKNTNNKETDGVLGMDSNEDGKMRVKVRKEEVSSLLRANKKHPSFSLRLFNRFY